MQSTTRTRIPSLSHLPLTPAAQTAVFAVQTQIRLRNIQSSRAISRSRLGKPEPVALNHCKKCGVAFFERGLTDDEANAYYSGYRDEECFRERNKFKPFYTRQHHDMISSDLSSQARRDEAKNHIVAAGLAPNGDRALDYGGGDGSLISGIDSKQKVVFAPSGSHGLAGIEIFKERKKLP